MLDMIDATYDYGFNRLKGILPGHTYGGYPGYCSGYNAGYGSAGLRSNRYRSEGIYDYQFMISNAMSGPYSWWEGIKDPGATPWEGTHPNTGSGSCPHMWGQSVATKVLVDSLMAEKSDGKVIVGRGIPNEWVTNGKVIELSNYPIKDNKRMGVKIEGLSSAVRLTLTGNAPAGDILFNLPVFAGNISSATAGSIDNTAGLVTIPSGTTSVTVYINNPNPTPLPTSTPPADPSTIDISNPGTTGYTFGQGADQVKRWQTFIAGQNPKITGVDVKIHKQGGSGQSNVTVELFATSNNLPAGPMLASATIPAGSVNIYWTVVNAPLTYNGIVNGTKYAVVLGQVTPGADNYEWCTAEVNSNLQYGKWNGSSWVDESSLGDGWAKIYTSASSSTSTPTPTATATPTPVATATPAPGTKYEAENAALSGGAAVNTNHTGYSGTGFVDGYWNSGATTTFTVNAGSAGTYNVDLRYSNAMGSNETLSIYVNGTKLRQVSLSNLANWDTWSDKIDTLTLNAGNNTIAYKYDTGDTGNVNLDYISLTATATATPTPTPTPGSTATPTPIPYTQNFNDGSIGGWTRVIGSGAVAVESYALSVDGQNSSTVVVDNNSPSRADGVLEFKVTPQGSNGRFQAIFRYSSTTSWAGIGYDVGTIWCWDNGAGQNGTFTGPTLNGGTTYTIKVRYVGSAITLWLDGTQVYSGTITQLPAGAGKIGVRTWSTGHNHFDDFVYATP
jgi:hypothetical protein